MPCHKTGCVSRYRYDRIAHYARKRYVDGIGTIELMSSAGSDEEKSLIALASLLDLDDDGFGELVPCCSNHCRRLMFERRDRLRTMIDGLLCNRRENQRKREVPRGAYGNAGKQYQGRVRVFTGIGNNRVLIPILSA